jgi:hypothetical protein
MNRKLRYISIVIVMVIVFGLVQYAAARDLILVASKETQKASRDWLGFLESKEIPVKRVTPGSYTDYKGEFILLSWVVLSNQKRLKRSQKML